MKKYFEKFKNLKSTNKKLYYATICMFVLVGFTFAYVIDQISSGAISKVFITADTSDILEFEVDKDISIKPTQFNFTQGGVDLSDNATATARLKANSTKNTAIYRYNVYFQISTNEYIYTTPEHKPEMILQVTTPNNETLKEIEGLTYNEELKGFDITNLVDFIAIAEDYEITSNSSTSFTEQKWIVTVKFINLDTNQIENEGKTLEGNLIIKRRLSLVEHIKSLYATQGSNNLYHHNGTILATELNSLTGVKVGDIIDANDGSYRYYGKYEEVNNWICFGKNDETETYADGWCDDEHLYRIIGIFNSTIIDEDGKSISQKEERVKLVKAYEGTGTSLGTEPSGTGFKNTVLYKGKQDSIPAYKWGITNNNWAASPLNANILNGTYLEKLDLDEDNNFWTNKIALTEWKVGGNYWYNIESKNAAIVYQNEVVNSATNAVINAKIGLMYLSDFGFASIKDNWTKKIGHSDDDNGYNSTLNVENNWLLLGITEWTISPYLNDSRNAIVVYRDGFADYNLVNGDRSVRPTFYLNSDVNFYGGSGTASDPYRIV